MSNTSGNSNYGEKIFEQNLKDLNMTRKEAADLVNCPETKAWVDKEAKRWVESEEQFKNKKNDGNNQGRSY